MTVTGRRRTRAQSGFTLVELIIALAISVVVATALVEIVLTTATASNVAFGRVEASSQIRSFELRAESDFARSSLPSLSGCGSGPGSPCSTAPIVLTGLQASNSTSPTTSLVTVTYAWDGTANLDRSVGGSSTRLGTSVTSFSWYEDSTTNTVVIEMTVTVLSYSESQSFVFYPRVS